MAPANQSDDIAALQTAVAALFRLLVKVPAGTIGPPAAAAGMSTQGAIQFCDGSYVPPPRQGVAFACAVLERDRARHAAMLATMRTPNRLNDLAETTLEGCQAAVDKLREDFPAWTVNLPDGHKAFTTGGNVRLVWRATRDDGKWPELTGATRHELTEKLGLVEASMKKDADEQARFDDGRGVRGRGRI